MMIEDSKKWQETIGKQYLCLNTPCKSAKVSEREV